MSEQLPLPDEPLLPYAGTSGHSGSDTSKERAERDDANGTTKMRQRQAYGRVLISHGFGRTWKELADDLNLHHGQASGVLSVLHKEGFIARLKEKRGNCAVYVDMAYIEGREVAVRKIKRCNYCGHSR